MSAVINLPVNVASALLPAAYETARTALAKCEKVDECKSWADKAAALASYARQAKDESLRRTAMRIQTRAIRRAGELLKQIEPQQGGNRGNAATGGRPPVAETRAKAADNAGLSEHQRKTALRLAEVPEDDFEQEVESPKPPTVTELAARGTKRRAVNAQRDQQTIKTEFLLRAAGACELARHGCKSKTITQEHIDAATKVITAWTELKLNLLKRIGS